MFCQTRASPSIRPPIQSPKGTATLRIRQRQGSDDLEAAHPQQVELENAQALDRVLVPGQLRKTLGRAGQGQDVVDGLP